jgi:hypothetical protein
MDGGEDELMNSGIDADRRGVPHYMKRTSHSFMIEEFRG